MSDVAVTARGVIENADLDELMDLVPLLQALLEQAGARNVMVSLSPSKPVLHDSPYECDECGGPSEATSSSGCRWCDGQGDIVPRGMARMRTWRPDAVRP